MKRCGDCTYAVTSFGSWGCEFNGHSIENTNHLCDDFICQFYASSYLFHASSYLEDSNIMLCYVKHI